MRRRTTSLVWVNGMLTMDGAAPVQQGTQAPDRVLVGIMTMFFATLALDMSVPAVVLSLMAVMRWLVLAEFRLVQPEGRTA